MGVNTIKEREHVERVIRECTLCNVGMVDEEGVPYVIPMNFGYEEGVIYLHSAQEGRSITILEKNPLVCITFSTFTALSWQHEEVACSYRLQGESVICYGRVLFEEDHEEKVQALNRIMYHYTGREFSYSDPAVKNVKVWKVVIEEASVREFGKPSKNALRFRSSRPM
ncbi:MAG: pyridoxamine 5'-phosphate oxidase family protein [Bacteroidota bacterium]|nr:pyridoxamine 5'-phosphate oxidase family protein [Bacteroidota bacterium]HHU97169.1 pyridoxamine 5'-phosphate oxidase family protein [Petrimonas sp.]